MTPEFYSREGQFSQALLTCDFNMKPATKPKDPLFKNAPPEIQRLNNQAKKELRLKRRAEWMKKQNGN